MSTTSRSPLVQEKIRVAEAKACQEEPNQELFEVCKKGDLEQVRSLISAANANTRECGGRKSTCLHFAAGYGRKEVCEYLLRECQADPSIKDSG